MANKQTKQAQDTQQDDQQHSSRRPQDTLQHSPSPHPTSIAEAVVIKDEDIFFLTEPDGGVPLEGTHGLGLYYHDCRFLNGYEMTMSDTTPQRLISTAPQGFRSVFELTNPQIQLSDGTLIRKERIGITWERMIDNKHLALCDQLSVRNYGVEAITVPLALTFQTQFEDLFAVRGMPQQQRGTLHAPDWQNDILRFAYDGADGIYRALEVQCWPTPDSHDGGTVRFNLELQAGACQQIAIKLTIVETDTQAPRQPQKSAQPDFHADEESLARSFEAWLDKHTTITSDNPPLNRVLDRSLRDLRMLRSDLNQQTYFAAGVPWFVALFGRDSLIAALQTLAYEPGIAEQTLRLLASYQGQREDAARAEQPGKIMHELRVGEMANLHEIPQTPYYGTIDATPLFVILVAQHAAWTGDLSLFNDLREHVDRALDWMDMYGALKDNGYLRYSGTSQYGLSNQGWKDSGDAIVNVDGSLATPPIALVEVQGYAYMAKISIADLYERAGDHDRAEQLRQAAAALRARFNRDFWLPDKNFYALALQQDNRPAAVIASNPGQALWTGIVDEDKAGHVAARLMADDMFNGWGIRTLSSNERRYNPVGYHLGTVWPHDNSIIAAGLRRYRQDDAAGNIFDGISAAAAHFRHGRLPEVFAGFGRDQYDRPVRYPVACHPQAWAAGSIPFLTTTLLGLMPDAFAQRLRIVRPILPDGVQRMEVQRLRVGAGQVDLRFEQAANGVAVQILSVEGKLKVGIEA